MMEGLAMAGVLFGKTAFATGAESRFDGGASISGPAETRVDFYAAVAQAAAIHTI